MQNLRRQLLLSYLLLIGLMLLLLVGGIARFFHLGMSINRVLDANVKSVLLMQRAKDALGEMERTGRKNASAALQVTAAIDEERGNITESGEQELADRLRDAFESYKTGNATQKSVQEKAQAILELNLTAMREADARAKAEARQSALLGGIVTAAAAVISVFLARRAVQSTLLPLVSLARQAQEIGAGRLNQRIEVKRSDEIGTLADAFNSMSGNLAEARTALESRLVRAERMSDTALESLYDPIIVTDDQGNIAYLNRAAFALFGEKMGERVGEARIAHAIDTAIKEGRSVAPEDMNSLVVVGERSYRLRVSPMQEQNRAFGTVVVLEDITDLHALDRLKTEFIGVASHELRTPVTSLLLSVQLLEEGAVGTLTAAQKEVIQAQRQDLERLEELLRDLLDLTKLESGVTTMQRVPTPVAPLVESVLTGVRAEAEAKGLTLTMQLGEVAESSAVIDAVQIGRVLTNLLRNAIRHTPSGGEVQVGGHSQDKSIALTVRDNGTGIPAPYLQRIFERFTQVPGATRGGAGLGLSLAKNTIEAHGGTIEAQSEGEGKGSIFTFTLPKE